MCLGLMGKAWVGAWVWCMGVVHGCGGWVHGSWVAGEGVDVMMGLSMHAHLARQTQTHFNLT